MSSEQEGIMACSKVVGQKQQQELRRWLRELENLSDIE
jgi:hypothetical protein